jgi:hypothetical protein
MRPEKYRCRYCGTLRPKQQFTSLAARCRTCKDKHYKRLALHEAVNCAVRDMKFEESCEHIAARMRHQNRGYGMGRRA